MDFSNWYSTNFESRLLGRYITTDHIFPILDSYKNDFEISVVGSSEKGKNIHLIKIGNGSKKIFGWSQMHGNESTTTKAVFDFLKFIAQKEYFQEAIGQFLKNYTFYIIPILNPDGAAAYTRVNANEVDLNRDAKNLTQAESIILRQCFENLKPELCLNLHDQRTIYGLDTGMPATISFLSPSADKKRSMTEERKIAMEYIVGMAKALKPYLKNQIGRYDDGYNENCIGDTFQSLKTPTILFEAGHFHNDYQREKTREFIFYAFLALFEISEKNKAHNFKAYFDIPENNVNYKDILIKNFDSGEGLKHLAIQYVETLLNDTVEFIPTIDSILPSSNTIMGHNEIDVAGRKLLINSQNSIDIGMKISKIVDQVDQSIVYFSVNKF